MNSKPVSRGARGPYRHGIVRRQEIVSAAAIAFAEFGYHGASLRIIAERVNTTPATLLSYFRNKEGLLVAVLEYWGKSSSVYQGSHTGLDFFRGLITLMEYHLENRGLIELFLTMTAEATNSNHPARKFILDRQEKTFAEFIQKFKEAEGSGEIHPMPLERMQTEARQLISFLDGIELQWLLDPRIDLVGIVKDQLVSAISRWREEPTPAIEHETDSWLSTRIRVDEESRLG